MPTRRSFVHQLITDEPMTLFSLWPRIRCQPRLVQSQLSRHLIRGRTVTSKGKLTPRFLPGLLAQNEQQDGFAGLLHRLRVEPHCAALSHAPSFAESGQRVDPCRFRLHQPTVQAGPSRPACTALLPVLQALLPPWPSQALSFLSLTWVMASCSRLACRAARMRSRASTAG